MDGCSYITASYKSLQQAGSEAYKAAQQAAKDTTVTGTESPSHRSKVVLDKPAVPTVKTTVSKTSGPKVKSKKGQAVLPKTKPATLKRRNEQLPSMVVAEKVEPPKLQNGSNQKVKAPKKAKEKPPRFSEQAGIEWFKKRGIKAEYSNPKTGEWDFPEDRKVRKGGEISSDSYKLRKKPRTTSDVKKGSRQSRSWNY